MMSLGPTDLKKGTIFQLNGQLYESLSYQQKVVGRQQATVSIKARHLKSNKMQQYTFSGSEDLKAVDLEKINVDFLYSDGQAAYFMSQSDFQQYNLSLSNLKEKLAYLQAGIKIMLILFEDQPLTVILPKNVWLEVVFAEEAVKGNTAQAITKTARLKTGLEVKVPAFIKVGDIISVDTENGLYRERQK